ncbi:hypothetical protein [Effusibacillus dendaii]|uniref:CN hydrolase domain-containing protein n=1 Tax=Effusibacillus dendaii TaxID=2743772 RepID=A0A7I8DDK0_9BACL|nr:hypothetical protein [Effusibacillus dendaii]BCJ87039.1 hypothetical protein skT53_20240 [Effusibacillus dendaii]
MWENCFYVGGDDDGIIDVPDMDMTVGSALCWEFMRSQTARRLREKVDLVVGAPVVHASHCGSIECAMPWLPVRYRGYYEAGAMIVDAEGRILASRNRHEGTGIVVAYVVPGRRPANPCCTRSFLAA